MNTQYNYSIIIPCRDRLELLMKAISSIPDRADIEIIVVDNSNIPLGVEVMPKMNNAQLSYFCSDPNKGAGHARNVGLLKINGKFILFLDSDDYFTRNAFDAFDKYLNQAFDIVYFQTDSINLVDGSRSNRHKTINDLVSSFLKNGDEDILRYRYVNPIAKMISSKYVLENGFQFDEIRVSNDVWFSIMTGHLAKRITADEYVVYMITAGDTGSSLTRKMTKENWFIRYQVMVRVNKFLKSIGKYKYRIRLLGALRIAKKQFGVKAFFELLFYAIKNRVGIF